MGVGEETGNKWNEPFQSNEGNSEQRYEKGVMDTTVVEALKLSVLGLSNASAFLLWGG